MKAGPAASVEVRLTPDQLRDRLRQDVAIGLRSLPKAIPSTWFYDERGSILFDEITRLEEYYQTRTERLLLSSHAAEIVALSGVSSLLELGSGTCEKTRVLLDEMRTTDRLRAIVAIDISAEMLARSVAELAGEYPSATVCGLVSDFDGALGALPVHDDRLVAFLGGTIGNLRPDERAAFFSTLAADLRRGDWFLLGCDLVKGADRLIAAYDDRAGVTAAFNRNVLSVLNRELGADFDPEAFTHVALWDDDERWIEMRLRSVRHQVVTLADLAMTVVFEEGEEMRTEISAKFTVSSMTAELATAGLATRAAYTDAHDDFALLLAQPAEQ
jgi:L-histidine N-alpha-methyltransferase